LDTVLSLSPPWNTTKDAPVVLLRRTPQWQNGRIATITNREEDQLLLLRERKSRKKRRRR
jgi:hypothetical protein